MRQQAKPFTVEVKKSRKSATEHQPLFGFLGDTALAEPPPRAVEANDKLFGRRPDRRSPPRPHAYSATATATRRPSDPPIASSPT